MARWKELPATLTDSERRLVVQLRRLKDRGGLSLAGLAARTSYSSSSWERYLNGKKPVPRGAVEELAALCGVPAEQLLVLHEVAEAARPPRPAPDAETKHTGSPGTPIPGAGDRPGANRTAEGRRATVPGRPRTAVAVAVAAVLMVFGAGFLAGSLWNDDGGTRGGPHASGAAGSSSSASPSAASAAPGATAYRGGQAYTCAHVARRDGARYAGYSTTRSALLDSGSTGWDVVEAQCLLSRDGFDPGRVDGVYGARTRAAAHAFQQRRGLVPDGIVGPDTWRELRK